MSARPKQIGEKQDDYECAPGFELFEESREQVTEDEQFKPGSKRRLEEVQRVRMIRAGGGTGAQQINRHGRNPGEEEKHTRFQCHPPAPEKRFTGYIFVVSGHVTSTPGL
jgi:hypothetical protein